jgi:hypothetical protein
VPVLTDPENLPPLTPHDPLGRGVFSSAEAKRWRRGADGGVTRTFDEPGQPSLSVDRLGHASDDVMTAIGVRIAAGREGNRNFYGWAVVSVDSAERMGRTVRVTPLDDNPYHADIDLNLSEGADQRDDRIEHVKDLADRAQWKERCRGNDADLA